MDYTPLIVIAAFLIVPLVSGICGALIGGARESATAGFFTGLILGPLGVLAAFRFDGRSKCPKCLERYTYGASVCPHCRHALR